MSVVTRRSHNPFLQQETLAAEAGAGGDVPRRARSLRPVRDRRHRRAAARGGLAHHAARRRDPDRSPARSAIRSASSRRCPAWRRSCRCCRSRSCAARARARRASCSTARASRCSIHLLSGPSVIHPEFIDEIQFYPGGAPAPYGGYTGGIVDGRTARARRDERLARLRRRTCCRPAGSCAQPVAPLGATVTAAGRYGYPGFLLGARDQPGVAVVLGLPAAARRRHARRNGWTVFVFGARDELDTPAPDARCRTIPNPPLEPSLILGFHRLDLRLHLHAGTTRTRRSAPCSATTARVSNGTDFSVWTRRAADRGDVEARQQAAHRRRRRGHVPRLRQGATALATDEPVRRDHVVARDDLCRRRRTWRRSGGRRPTCSCGPACAPTSTPTTTTTKPAVDPRLTAALPLARARSARRAARQRRARGLAQGERRHLPPAAALRPPAARPRHDAAQVRPLALVPDQPRRRGAAARTTSSSRSRASSTTWTRRSSICRSTRRRSVTDPNRSILPTSIVMPMTDAQEFIDRLTAPQLGRAYGLEVLLAPAVEDRPLRLDLVHAVALRALSRRRLGAVRLRSHASLQRGRGAAAAPQLGPRPAPAVPERPPDHDDRRLQRRVRRRATFVSTCASTSAPSGGTGCSTSTSTSRTSRCSPRRSSPAPSSATSFPPSACAADSRSHPLSLWERARVRGPRGYSARTAVANDRSSALPAATVVPPGTRRNFQRTVQLEDPPEGIAASAPCCSTST